MRSDQERFLAAKACEMLTRRGATLEQVFRHRVWHMERLPLQPAYKFSCGCGWSMVMTDVEAVTTAHPAIQSIFELHAENVMPSTWSREDD